MKLMKTRLILVGCSLILTNCATKNSGTRLPSEDPAAGVDATQVVATIVNSGSTNTPKWSISVLTSGSSTLAVSGTIKNFNVSPDQSAKLFADLNQAKSAGTLASSSCPKSASFGSETVVHWSGWSSPDLSCSMDPKSALAPLFSDEQKIEQASNLSAVIADLQHPVAQQSAALPHCQTPDGRYSITINEVYDHLHHFAVIKDLTPPQAGQSEGAFDFYDVNGSSPFTGQGSVNNRFSKGEQFMLTLASSDYEKDTDASLKAGLIDQRTDNNGKQLNPDPVQISYDHVICTRWYR